MSHTHYVKVDIDAVIKTEPIAPGKKLRIFFWLAMAVGITTFFIGLIVSDPKHFWGSFYVNTLFWMGLAFGGLFTALIFQIVRAKWAGTIRRVGEANISFIPYALIALFTTYIGKDYLFPWATKPMPGREAWMQPNFVYIRFFILMLGLYGLFYMFTKVSLRSDAGFLADKPEKKNWKHLFTNSWLKNWKGESEILGSQVKMSYMAPAIVFAYAVIYSLFAFEMIMSTDTIWYSNMFGGFNFIGNIGMGWAMMALTIMYLRNHSANFKKVTNKDQLWDIGKLQLGFTMLWGYLFFSQYLPQWYGNLPEETAWMLARVRGTWMPMAYFVLSCCFIIPFVMLLSEDLKKTTWTYCSVIAVILTGYWFEKYTVIMPQMFPNEIPFLSGFGLLEVGLFLGFLGTYGICIQNFFSKYPYIPVSHPLTRTSDKW